MTKPGPTISARKTRQCVTCYRTLPRRAYRRQCATCLKYDRGGCQRTTIIHTHGQVRVIQRWEYDSQLIGGEA